MGSREGAPEATNRSPARGDEVLSRALICFVAWWCVPEGCGLCCVTNHVKSECLTWAVGVVCVLHSSNVADRMRMSADFEKLQAENKELRAVLAGRGVLAPPAQGTSDATGLPLEEAPAPPPILPALRQ